MSKDTRLTLHPQVERSVNMVAPAAPAIVLNDDEKARLTACDELALLATTAMRTLSTEAGREVCTVIVRAAVERRGAILDIAEERGLGGDRAGR